MPRIATSSSGGESEYLTTAEVARLLRLNQKKVYLLLQAGRLPAARVSGKWLFPRELVRRWVAENTVYPPAGVMGALLDTLLVVQGSDDWLLSAALDALRSRHGLAVASAPVGSAAGLRALASGGAHAAGFHLDDREAAAFVPPGEVWYVVDLAEREQGLIFPARRGRPRPDLRTAAAARLRFADRQAGSGTHLLARRLFAEAGAEIDRLRPVGPYASHLEVGLAVRAGLADLGIGTRVAAHLCGLAFTPLHRERFRLAVPGRVFGHPRMATFLRTLLDEFGAAKDRGLPGYGFDALGRTRPLGPPQAPAAPARRTGKPRQERAGRVRAQKR